MVKKYPFSQKAVKAMMAAAIALTPAVTTASFMNAEQAAAAEMKAQASWHFDTTANLANYSNAIYDGIKTNSDVSKVASALDQITAEEWYNIVYPILEQEVKNDEARLREAQAIAGFMETYIGLVLLGIDGQELNQFFTDTSPYLNNASPGEYLAYLENVESQLYGEYVAQTNDGQDDNVLQLYTSALRALRSAEDPSGKIQGKLQEMISLATNQQVNESALAFINTLQAKDSEIELSTIKNAALVAGTRWEALYDQPQPQPQPQQPAPAPSPAPDEPSEEPEPGTVTPSPTPEGPITVTPVVTETATTVTATLPAATQAQIVEAATAETTEVVLTIPVDTEGKTVALEIPGTFAENLQGKAPSANVVISTNGVNYVLPLSRVDLASLGVDLANATLRVSIDTLTDTESTDLLERIEATQNTTAAASSETKAAAIIRNIELVAPAVEVKVEATAGGKTVEIKSFGDIYVEREFVLNQTVNTNNTTGVVVAADGSVKALPTTFKIEDGQHRAVVRSLTNGGLVTVTESDVTFPDINNGQNWAERYIESLASKFVISGTTAGTYKPDQDMTRSQFAFLLSRALGLPGTTAYDGRFSDVEGDEWFNANGELMAAVKYGLVLGKANGTFGADEKVTRAEAAAMIGRALELGFISFDESKLNTSKRLADFKDVREIGASTRAEVLKVYQAGIMAGSGSGEFNPNEYTKRDQMARILAEFLIKANLMENIK